MRHLLTTAVVVWAAAVTGCALDVQNLGGVSAGAKTGEGGGGAGAGGGDEGTWAFQGEAACTATRAAPSKDCPKPCGAVTFDVELFCEDAPFGARGVKVAPAGEATWLTTVLDDRLLLVRADASGLHQEGGLPPIVGGRPLFLALSNGGEVELVTDFTPGSGYGTMLTHVVQKDGAWQSNEVFDSAGMYDLPVGFQIAPGGVRHLWLSPYPDVRHLTQEGSGAWTVQETFSGADLPSWTVTLTNEGKQAVLWYDQTGGEDQLTLRVDGVEEKVGSPVASDGSSRWLAVPHPLPSPVTGPPLVALIRHPGELRLAWPDGGSFQEVVLPHTPALPSVPCGFLEPPPCGLQTCGFSGTGVDRGAYAVARTADGTVWVALVITSGTHMLHAEESCDVWTKVCSCQWIEDAGTASATLRLVRVPLSGGAPEEVLSLPTEAVLSGDYWGDVWAESPIDMRAFGGELAIGLLTRRKADDAGSTAIRLLRIDTTLL